MLDLYPSSLEHSNSRVTMDFSPYLLSASPPALSFEFLGYSTHNTLSNLAPVSSPNQNANNQSRWSLSSLQMSGNGNLKERRGNLKPIIIKTDSLSDSEGETVVTPESPKTPLSPLRKLKKVSFADHKGLALAQIRLVKESPDEPPELSPSLIAALTLGANADVTENPPIKLCFPQPASDYLAFRDKITKNCVSLENVILRDYTIQGTIKVKNISFEKRVFVRFSSDEWKSSHDFEATHVPGPSQGFKDAYDTFTFTIDIAPNFDMSKTQQFAVCFEQNGSQHWDNNDGSNYTIVSEHYEEHRHLSTVPTLEERYLPVKHTDSWSEFTAWRDVDNHTRFY